MLCCVVLCFVLMVCFVGLFVFFRSFARSVVLFFLFEFGRFWLVCCSFGFLLVCFSFVLVCFVLVLVCLFVVEVWFGLLLFSYFQIQVYI